MPLAKDDIQNLLHSIIKFWNIKILSLKLEDPSWVIDILDWWKQTHSIISITLKVISSFSLQQNYEIKLKINELKCQGIRVYIYGKSLTLNFFLVYYIISFLIGLNFIIYNYVFLANFCS